MKNLKLTALAAIVAFSTQVFAANFSVQSTTNNEMQLVSEDFLEIDVATLPKLVVEAVQKEHEGATISKAFVNQDGAYKLVLDTKDENSTILYANAKGEWLDMEAKEE